MQGSDGVCEVDWLCGSCFVVLVGMQFGFGSVGVETHMRFYEVCRVDEGGGVGRGTRTRHTRGSGVIIGGGDDVTVRHL